MTRVICVTAGKGGVGKTTTVSNLGVALSNMGKDVIVVDANLTTPNLSLHMGIPLYPITLHDVLKGNAYITEAMHICDQNRLRVVPGSLSLDDMEDINPDSLEHHIKEINGSTEIVFLDCAAGLGQEAIAAMRSSDDILIICNPELPSVTDALKSKKLAEDLGVNVLGVVVTRYDKKKSQMSDEEIEEMLEAPIIGRIPEDKSISHAISKKNPVMLHNPSSPSSKAYKKLAADMVGEKYTYYDGSGFFTKMRSFLVGG